MRAVVFVEPGTVAVQERPEPVVERSTDAIVRVTRAGICGSDLHFFHGKAPIEPGSVMGHEAVGVVASTGPDVEVVRVGDRVVVSFHLACGACWFCRHGQSALCEHHAILGAGPFGGDLPGAQAQFVRVPHANVNLLPVPDGVGDEPAVFVGDVLTTGVYAAARAQAGPDDAVAVLGAGPVGFCTAHALIAGGAGRVYVVDRVPKRLALAATIGAVPIDATTTEPEMALARATDGRGADIVVEAVGSREAFETATAVVRRGGRIVVVGMYAGEAVELQLGVWWARALEVRFAGETPVHAWWDRAMDGLASGTLDPSPLVSHRLPLDEAPAGYTAFDRHEASKVLLDPWA
jgi:threonine dehydrogenase-like Zn-dependent dehydrogenase